MCCDFTVAPVQAVRANHIFLFTIVAWNKHEWTSEGILFHTKSVHTIFFLQVQDHQS